MVGVLQQFDPFETRRGHALSWKRNRWVKGSTTSTILNGLTRESQPGQLTAVLGHSGRYVCESLSRCRADDSTYLQRIRDSSKVFLVGRLLFFVPL